MITLKANFVKKIKTAKSNIVHNNQTDYYIKSKGVVFSTDLSYTVYIHLHRTWQ